MIPDYFKDAFTIAQPLGLLVVACIGVWIAYRQHKTAREQAETTKNKLLLDLFDRRMTVFEEMREFQRKVTAGKPTKEEDLAFGEKVLEAEFLFGPEVTQFLKDMHERPAHITNYENAQQQVQGDEDEKERLRKQIVELRAEHMRSYEKAWELFRPYLGFDHVMGAKR